MHFFTVKPLNTILILTIYSSNIINAFHFHYLKYFPSVIVQLNCTAFFSSVQNHISIRTAEDTAESSREGGGIVIKQDFQEGGENYWDDEHSSCC